ncbi:MAG: fluoride efflux transporter CrcB [Chloroflexota bacterium]
MNKILLIGMGGFIGSILRYWLSGWVQQALKSSLYPFGTLTVNIFGCLVIGFLSGLAEQRGVFTPEARAFAFIGVLGGFTTFSTFGNETFGLLQDGQTLSALVNIALHLVFGVGAVWLGRTLAFLIWR